MRSKQATSLVMILFLLAVSISGCVARDTEPQMQISVFISDQQEVDSIRELIATFARLNGYDHRTLGDVPNLVKTGQFMDGFHDDGFKNYITSSNYRDPTCVGIAIYSEEGTAEAKQMAGKLSSYLVAQAVRSINIKNGDVCPSKEVGLAHSAT